MAKTKTWVRGGLVVLLCLLFTVVAFAGGKSEAAPAQKGFVVGLSNGPFTHSWRVQMAESLQKQFDVYRERGWASKLIVQNAGPDVNTQIAQIRNLIASKVDLLLVNPNSATALNPVLKEAVDAKIVVIVYDQPVKVPNGVLNVYMNQEYWQGPVTEWLCEELNGKGNIVYISGIADQPGNIARDKAAMDVLAKYPGINLLAKANGNWDQAAAQQVMTDLLGSFPNIDGVLTQDGMTLGIIRAFQAAGAICTSLGIGLRLLRGKELKPDAFAEPNTIWTHPVLSVDNSNIDKIYDQYKDWADSYYVNTWYSEEQIDALFK
jgi:ribose transport system substrate-binding protein